MQHFIATYGYLAVFVLMLAESACIPVPSEVVMLFGGAMAAGGVVHGSHSSLIGIIAAGALGNVVGSYLAWWAGRHWGQAAVRSFGRRIHIHERDIDRATDWFNRHGPTAVLVGRVVPVIRTFISLPAGFADMPAVRFGVYTALGCIPWTAGLGIAGYQLGSHWDKVAKAIQNVGYGVIALIVLAIAVLVIMRMRRRRAAPQEDYPPHDEPPHDYYGYPAQPVYPFPHEAPHPQGPSPAERFWAQSWDTPPPDQPSPDRAVHPEPVSYQQYWSRAPQGQPAQPAPANGPPQPGPANGRSPYAAPANGRPPQPAPAYGHPSQPGPANGRPPQPGPAYGHPPHAPAPNGRSPQPQPAYGHPQPPAPGYGQPPETAPADGRPPQPHPAQRGPAYPPPRNQRPDDQWGR